MQTKLTPLFSDVTNLQKCQEVTGPVIITTELFSKIDLNSSDGYKSSVRLKSTIWNFFLNQLQSLLSSSISVLSNDTANIGETWVMCVVNFSI